MGFFSSSQTTKSESTYENPLLKQYTQLYRSASPWGFASLDPTATLAAMGGGTSVGGKNLGANFKNQLKGMSAEEKAQAQASQDALARIQERQTSGKFLTPQETEFVNSQLDKAFASSRSQAYSDWTRATQELAGSRGLRTGDTPVADPAMRSLRDMELGFSSQRAGAGLDATMKLSAQQQMFDSSLMDSLNTLGMNRWNARQSYLFGGGLQAAGNLGFKTTSKNTVTGNPSMLQNISSTMGVIDQGMSLASKFGSMGANMGMFGGGGGAASSMGGGGWGGMMGVSSNPYK